MWTPNRQQVTMIMIVAVVANFHGAASQTPPFPFGYTTGGIFTPPGDDSVTSLLALPKPMAYSNVTAKFVSQSINGYISLYAEPLNFSGYVYTYFMDIDTRNGGADQNQVWLHVGDRSEDLHLARDLIAGNGTLFVPQALVVATWYKVEAAIQLSGPQNTFQLAMAYSETGETWGIFSYSQLQYFQSNRTVAALVEYKNSNFGVIQSFFRIGSNSAMNSLFSGTNCNRTGTYVFRIHQGGPTKAPTSAPTKAPTSAPTKAPATTAPPSNAPTATCGLLGWSIFCPLTLCGIFGRWLGFCPSA